LVTVFDELAVVVRLLVKVVEMREASPETNIDDGP
jgi:hypothetical protein